MAQKVGEADAALAAQAEGALRLCVTIPASAVLSQTHLVQSCATQQAIGIGEGFDNLEMVVTVGNQKLGALAHVLHGGGKVTRLTLELRCLMGSISDDHGSVQMTQVALRAQCLHALIAKFYVRTARGQGRTAVGWRGSPRR